MTHILIIGGYGNFGRYIAETLCQEKNLKITIAGRSHEKAQECANELGCEYAVLDVFDGFDNSLSDLNPTIVIHTSGPFQGQGYDVAQSCLDFGCHYIDLADGREFVCGIDALNDRAQESGVSIIAGASSVPCLSSAVVDHYKDQFETLTNLEYGIATAQQTNRGLATTNAILSYVGKPFTTLIDGEMRNIYGWHDAHLHDYPKLGKRPLGNCDIPDLALFPKAYPNLKNIRFYAGTELYFQHFGLWMMSWLVKWGFVKSLQPLGKILVKIANMFDWLGSSNSAFHMKMSGVNKDGAAISKTFYLTAKDGHGPYIPCMPAILLAKKLASGDFKKKGAFSSMRLVSFTEYMAALSSLNIHWELKE